jgi:hypothetical protein
MTTVKIAKIAIPALVVIAALVATVSTTMGTDDPVQKAASAKQSVTQQPPRSTSDVLYTTSAEASLKHDYDTIAELNKSDAVEAIVEGTVTATQDVYKDEYARRLLTVDVQKCFKGQTKSTIQVYEDGGLVPIKLLLPELQAKGVAGDLTQQQIDSGVVDMRFLGATHSEVGDKVLLYLYSNPNPGEEGTYLLVSCTHGRFTLNGSTGQWERVSASARPNYETRVDKNVLEAQLEALQ